MNNGLRLRFSFRLYYSEGQKAAPMVYCPARQDSQQGKVISHADTTDIGKTAVYSCNQEYTAALFYWSVKSRSRHLQRMEGHGQ